MPLAASAPPPEAFGLFTTGRLIVIGPAPFDFRPRFRASLTRPLFAQEGTVAWNPFALRRRGASAAARALCLGPPGKSTSRPGFRLRPLKRSFPPGATV